jgi:phytoene dehydrogenase-like protein
MSTTHYDAIIIGGGHNGLTAAAYLARGGRRVAVLERKGVVGGAAISSAPFKGLDARLSRYAYLVSLLPNKIVQDLALDITLLRRRVASYTPTVRQQRDTGLLIHNDDAARTAESFAALGCAQDAAAYARFYQLTTALARHIFPTLTQPLQSKAALYAQLQHDADAREAWAWFIERPLGEAVEHFFADDLVRGVVFTDAKIGALTHPHDPTLLQNRTFLYHVIGNGTGEWRVPQGGMGAVSGALAVSARQHGAALVTGAHVSAVHSDGRRAEVHYSQDGDMHTLSADWVLVNAAPQVLDTLLSRAPRAKPRGVSFKINMLLTRLPELRARGIAPHDAFSGTFHIDEGYQTMIDSYHAARDGRLPSIIPSEIYCHTLTDPSILSPSLAAAGYHTLTLFGLDAPAEAFDGPDRAATTQAVLTHLLTRINATLAEPLEDCLARDADDLPCIEAKSARDLEDELGLPNGNIFHADLAFPFDDARAAQWGVETDIANVLLCGSGAVRGGAVSGIAGHNAAMKVLHG